MAGGDKKSGGKLSGLKETLWDSENRLFFGRSGVNWAKLGVFYLVFYTCLAAFFAAMVAAFYATVDDQKPKLTGKSSLLKGSPAIGFRPTPDYETTLISFRPGEHADFDQYVNNIAVFLKDYENVENAVDCSTAEATDENACKIEVSEFLQANCTKDNFYGYKSGHPCVLLRLNKVFDWVPDVEGDSVEVKCTGENPADIENLGNVVMYPAGGWNKKYFPYKNQVNYRSPLVMVTFPNLVKGVIVMVECRAYANNIKYDKQRRLGMVHFELLVKY